MTIQGNNLSGMVHNKNNQISIPALLNAPETALKTLIVI